MTILKVEEFAKALLHERTSLNLTTYDVSVATDISTSTISRAERGIGVVDIENYVRLCKWMNVPITRFLDIPDMDIEQIDIGTAEPIAKVLRLIINRTEQLTDSQKWALIEIIDVVINKVLKEVR